MRFCQFTVTSGVVEWKYLKSFSTTARPVVFSSFYIYNRYLSDYNLNLLLDVILFYPLHHSYILIHITSCYQAACSATNNRLFTSLSFYFSYVKERWEKKWDEKNHVCYFNEKHLLSENIYTVPVKSLETPVHLMVFLYVVHCRLILKTSELRRCLQSTAFCSNQKSVQQSTTCFIFLILQSSHFLL